MALNMYETLISGYVNLLLGYASGSLDQAQNLVVATHLTYSPKARSFVDRCEAIGGSLIENMCEPVSMNENALESVLGQLDAPKALAQDLKCPGLGFGVPTPLKSRLQDCEIDWHTVFPGMAAYDIQLECDKSKARFMKAKPGLKSPHHHHRGIEITLVMDGAFEDETGAYSVGDMIVTDENTDHTPVACEKMGCTCLVVTSAPIKLTGIASLLNPFLKA